MAKDSERIFFEGGELKGADLATWKLIPGDFFSVDAKGVYYASHKLGGAKPQDWKILQGKYSVSGKNVYYMAWRLQGADLDSFEILKDGSCRDKISAFVGKHRAK